MWLQVEFHKAVIEFSQFRETGVSPDETLDRLNKADQFISNLKQEYAGRTNAQGEPLLRTDEGGNITNLNEENRKKYEAILGPQLYQRVHEGSAAAGGHANRREQERQKAMERKSKMANIDPTPTWKLDELADNNRREQEAAQLASIGSEERAVRERQSQEDRETQARIDSVGPIDTTGIFAAGYTPFPGLGENVIKDREQERQKEITDARARDQASAGTARGNLANVGQPQPPAVARQAETKKQIVLANTRTNRQRHRLQGSIESDEERLKQLRDSGAPAGKLKGQKLACKENDQI